MRLEEEGLPEKRSAWEEACRKEMAKCVVGQGNGIGEWETKAQS